MSVYKLVAIVSERDRGGLPVRRNDVKLIYGAGFEGALLDALEQGLVEIDESHGLIALSTAARRHAQTCVVAFHAPSDEA